METGSRREEGGRCGEGVAEVLEVGLGYGLGGVELGVGPGGAGSKMRSISPAASTDLEKSPVRSEGMGMERR